MERELSGHVDEACASRDGHETTDVAALDFPPGTGLEEAAKIPQS